jgi:alkaline phosphatase
MGYTETTVEDLVDPLKGMKTSANGVIAQMGGDYSEGNFTSVVKEWWGIDLYPGEYDEIAAYAASVGWSYAMARIVSEYHTVIGWTTHGHNGETVPVWMYPKPAPTGIMDNTDLAKIAAKYLGSKLDYVTDYLYRDVGMFELDDTDPANPVVMIGDVAFPVNKDYMMYRGETYQMPGLTVYAPMTGKAYVSQKALNRALKRVQHGGGKKGGY